MFFINFSVFYTTKAFLSRFDRLSDRFSDRSDFMVFRTIKSVRDKESLFVNLIEGFLGGTIYLELKDINPVLGSAHGIRPADGGLYLDLGVVAKPREKQNDDCLEMLLLFRHL